MDYKLGIKLQKAGFPGLEIIDETLNRLPTLSELIEACGDGFWSLCRIQKNEFQVVGPYRDKDEIERRIINFNKTPEEAVANLWLALNPKSSLKLQTL